MGRAGRLVRIGSASGLAAIVVMTGFGAATAAAASKPTCDTSNLSAKVTGTAAGMSQPSTFITLTNTGTTTCKLKGYPTITRVWTKKGKVAVTVTKGGVQNAPQVKVKKVVLKPGQHAWFAIGTATAYDPPVVTLTKVAVATAAGTSVADSLKVKISQQATAPKGKPIPIGVTPYAKGTGTGE